MIAKILLLTFFISISFTAIIRPIAQDQTNTLPSPINIIGGYTQKTDAQIKQLKKDSEFSKLVQKVRNFWKQNMKQNLSENFKLETQLVAGLNYRFTFTTTSKPNTFVTITVFTQAWTSTQTVTQTNPVIPGGIKDGNLNKSISKN